MTFMQINFSIRVPDELEDSGREERVKIDLDTIILGIHNIIPQNERKNIKVIDGNEVMHEYESFSQIEEIYKSDGKIGLIYVGKDFLPYTSN